MVVLSGRGPAVVIVVKITRALLVCLFLRCYCKVNSYCFNLLCIPFRIYEPLISLCHTACFYTDGSLHAFCTNINSTVYPTSSVLSFEGRCYLFIQIQIQCHSQCVMPCVSAAGVFGSAAYICYNERYFALCSCIILTFLPAL